MGALSGVDSRDVLFCGGALDAHHHCYYIWVLNLIYRVSTEGPCRSSGTFGDQEAGHHGRPVSFVLEV